VEPGAVALLLQVEGEDLHPGLVGNAEQGQARLHDRKHKYENAIEIKDVSF
jgi:hypothetical protein